jgi:predicted phosphodiesterase
MWRPRDMQDTRFLNPGSIKKRNETKQASFYLILKLALDFFYVI